MRPARPYKIKAIKIPPQFVLIPFLLAAISARGQNPEVTTKESAVTFRSGINLVSVPVIVRDSKGNPVDNLTIDDFQLSDNGKPQLISKFSIERLEKTPPPGDAAAIPTRFVAYLFDDVHMTPRDLIETRDAVTRRIDAASDPRQRIAIYSTSGITLQDFTAGKSQLHAALSSLHIGPAGGFTSLYQDECPSMTYYEAHLVYNDRDQDAIALANADATACGATPDELERVVQDRAREVLTQGDRTTQASLDAIRNVTARLASMLGKRTIVLISPRLVLLNNSRDQQTSIIDGAIHANVVIGALDRNDVSEHEPQAAAGEIVTNTAVLSKKLEYAEDEASISSSVVESIAEGTGGVYVRGSGAADDAIARIVSTPGIMYLLSFSPLDLKPDGKLHNLKVTLKSPHGLDLQFRKSYYAPQAAADPTERAQQELEEAFFSRDEIHDLPAALETQFFKSPNGDATISTVAKLDVKNLNFRRENDRNLDNVIVVTGLFDADGNFMTGIQKIIELRLLDQTIHTRLAGGLGIKNTFPVHTGKYIVRMVARDSEGGLLASQSALVEIP